MNCEHFKTGILNDPAVHSWRAMNTLGKNSCHTPLGSLAYNRDSTEARGCGKGACRIALVDSRKLLAAFYLGSGLLSHALPTAGGPETLIASVH